MIFAPVHGAILNGDHFSPARMPPRLGIGAALAVSVVQRSVDENYGLHDLIQAYSQGRSNVLQRC